MTNDQSLVDRARAYLVSGDANSGTSFLICELADELEAYDQTFELQRKADQRAVDMWREANPGNELVRPDQARLAMWLMDRDLVDAERWRVLMASARMHYMGSSGFIMRPREGAPEGSKKIDDLTAWPNPCNDLHFGMEFWDRHPAANDPKYPDRFERELMVAYVDALRARGIGRAKT